MSSCDQELIAMFETNGMSPEQIADDTGYDIASVKALLMQYSQVYKQLQKTDKSLDFTDEEFETCKDVLMDIAKYERENNPHLALKAAIFVIQDKKGYLDPRRALPTLNVNVLDFNGRMKAALAAEERTQQKAIEINARKEELIEHTK